MGFLLIEPPAQETFERLHVWEKRDEEESSTKRRIAQRDRSIRCVHRPDEPEIWRQAEGCVAVLQGQRLAAVFQQKIQLAEHFCDIGAVDLVDDEHMLVAVAPSGTLSE
jgi:hypothetical protein